MKIIGYVHFHNIPLLIKVMSQKLRKVYYTKVHLWPKMNISLSFWENHHNFVNIRDRDDSFVLS